MIDAALQDKNPDTRQQAVIALSLSVARQPWTGKVINMLDDRDVPVRVATVLTLVDLREEDTKQALHKALDDTVPEVSYAAAKALFSLGDPAGKEALLAVLEKESKTASGFFTKEKREAIRMLHTPHALFLFAVRQGAGMVPLPGFGMGVSSMEQILTDPGTSGRAAAALLLSKDKDEQTLQALKDAISDNNWSVRAACVHALAVRNDPAQRDALEPMLLDKSLGVRLRAAVGWLRLDAIAHGVKPPVPPRERAAPTRL